MTETAGTSIKSYERRNNRGSNKLADPRDHNLLLIHSPLANQSNRISAALNQLAARISINSLSAARMPSVNSQSGTRMLSVNSLSASYFFVIMSFYNILFLCNNVIL
jgi:hypothetical protein